MVLQWCLKAYSHTPDWGRSQKFKNLKTHFPKGIEQKSFQGQIRAIFPEILVYENLFNTVVYGAIPMHIIMHNL